MEEADFSWVEFTEPWQRVKWARKRKFATAKAAADALSMPDVTYRQYERPAEASGSARLDIAKAREFGRKFKVRWDWLILGEGEPWVGATQDPDSPAGRVLNKLPSLDKEAQEMVANMVERLSRTGTGG